MPDPKNQSDHQRHLEDLRKSLLTDETNRLCKFGTWVDADRIGEALNWNGPATKLGACLHLPYFTLDGTPITNFSRFRPLPENRPLLNGKRAKYLSPKGGGTRLYFPPRSRAGRLQDKTVPIIIVEGEKKAALLDQLGYAVIGLCGVSCWSAPREKDENGEKIGKRKLHPDFAGIHLGTPIPQNEPSILSTDNPDVKEPEDRRDVFICFDSDIGCKPGVAWEEYHLASALEAAGAKVRCIRIPDDYDGDRSGIDDYLVGINAKGFDLNAEMAELMSAATKPKLSTFGLKNFQIVKIVDDKGKEEDEEVPLPAAMIAHDLIRQTRGWPRRVNSSLFVRDGDNGPLWLSKPNELFAWMQRGLPITNPDYPSVHWKDKGNGLTSKGEFDAYLQQTVTHYESVESAPHYPKITGHYYIHPPIPTVDISGKLDALLKWFKPATDEDGLLLVAWLLTLFWGGPYGQRPAFLFTGEDDDKEMGRGIGKTTLVRMSAKLCGGTFDIRQTDKWDEVLKRLLSNTACSTQRVMSLDNIKTHRFSWADVEALITSENVNGRKLYVGDGRRPNTFVVAITLNGASLSKDLAQRCVIVKMKRPTYSGNWESDLAAFIDANRWEIIGDIIALLKTPVQKIAGFTRWGTWERDIIGRLPNPEALQKLIRERREAVDDDQEEADLIRDAIAQELRERGHGEPNEAGVRIPAAAMAEIVGKALSEKLTTTTAGTKLKAIGGAIPELTKKTYCGRKLWLWTGRDRNPTQTSEELRERPFHRQWG